jgi:hypothetical protein
MSDVFFGLKDAKMRLGFFSRAQIHFHFSARVLVGSEFQSTGPFPFLRHAAHYGEVNFSILRLSNNSP